ncbi:hypothetical protein HETIRDRAFT_429562 [Heterobasidion irregulare TC 32-1]|uniref:RNA polymerase III subunit C6 n=1 Tax=Heterobasidion irregulare (strain TC 32-1) TaxID=747525 RepID=W4JUU7_HETIT|nr:uncharacterized protein HETIRDRAFT_429562 [Heterobasidion irregulare TC 32-1]ETW77264.1 hypothetical protein HETIRDRAFT_429562 [Heterobasidion irregulare TC 32-1]
MPPSAGRKPNELEAKLHHAALQASRPLTQKEIDILAPDAKPRTGAINFLLGAGMIKVMKDNSGGLLYRAVTKEEVDMKKGMSGEESMVLSHIQSAENQGIWTKHLKVKTELHQTVLDRCLKQLVQKGIIKAVKGMVKYPTRKIYMMAHLEPSVELTGGPWYTDNELDTEFIKLLCTACLRFIQDRSLPKHKLSDDIPASSRPLYPISSAPPYPNCQQVLSFLSKSKITETQLSEEHVDMLLNVLVLDGEVEKLPSYGASLWIADDDDDAPSAASSSEPDSDDDSDDDAKQKKRKRKNGLSSRKRKKHRAEDEMSTDEHTTSPRKKAKGKRAEKEVKGKKRKRSMSDSEGEVSESERELKKKRKKRKKADDSESSDEGSEEDRSKRKSRSKSKKRIASPDESATESDSDSDSDDSTSRRKRSRSKLKSSKSKSSKSKPSSSRKKSRARSSSPVRGPQLDNAFAGSAYVYRAVRQERVALGWAEAPCARCPIFDFCRDGGPVGPRQCEYYGSWLARGAVAVED